MTRPEPNLYAILGLPWCAPENQIRAAYRKLAKQLHPDLNPDNPQAEELFKQIAQAYWVLADSERRQAYIAEHPHFSKRPAPYEADQTTVAYAPQHPPTPAQPEDGRDMIIRLYLTLEEVSTGVAKKIKIKRWENCPACDATGISGGVRSGICNTCKGSGEVPDFTGILHQVIPCRKCGGTGMQSLSACSTCMGKGQIQNSQLITVGIPVGCQERDEIIIKGQGHEGRYSGAAGDLKVFVSIKDHPYFQRRDHDLIYHCSITLLQWFSGCEIKVPSLNGPISLNIPSKSKPKSVLRVRGRGLPEVDGHRGDILVHYDLCLPKQFSKKQLSLLKKLEETEGFQLKSDKSGFYPRLTKSES